MLDGAMPEITSMITLRAVPAYSHATPVAPAGSGVPPPPGTAIGFETLIPKAAPTVSAVGQLGAPAVADWLEGGAVEAAAEAAVEADEVAAVAADVVPVTVDGDPPLEPPQAASVTLKTSAVVANQRESLCDT